VSARAAPKSPGRRRFDALFLDRDGTLIVERGFLKDPKGVRLCRGAAERLRIFTDAGTLLFIVTNQSGVARGVTSPDEVVLVNAEVRRRLGERGVIVTEFLVCPHHPEGSVPRYTRKCRCRKPGTLLHRRALKAYGIVPGRSAVFGDRWEDVGAGIALGATAVHLLTGYGREHRAIVKERAPDAILARTLADGLDRLQALARNEGA
jgi:D-glycero-D-manno-heptose 1,7-bisphosphate phosphatase